MHIESAATQLARRFSEITFAEVSAESRLTLKRLVMDYLGVAISGSQTESGRIARRFAREHGGHGRSTLVGDGTTVDMTAAAFANAISSHSVELDDVDVLALFHFSPPVLSAALATAEQERASGQRLLTAVAAGAEMMERLSVASNPTLRDRGFHTTPTCGTFGAAVAAGSLLSLEEGQMTSALGLAGAQAGGLMEMYGPSMQKRFNPGPAARAGVTAAVMARMGFTGADTIFEGENGFLGAFSDQPKADALVLGLGDSYPVEIEFKPYSCARPIHNAIDCALDIRGQAGFSVASITAIHVKRHPDWARYHQNSAPGTYHEAQVSLPFSVAIALIEARALPAQYTDRLHDPEVRRLSAMITTSEDGALSRGVSCEMTVTVDGGRRISARVDYPKGSIQNPMSDQELRAKFESLAGPVIGHRQATTVAEQAMDLEQIADISTLLRMTSRVEDRS